MTLDDIRRKINTIDFEILKLLNSRMEFALRTKNLKSAISDPKRESEVIRYIQSHSGGLIEPDFCKKLFLEIIGESKRLQNEEVVLIGFQGEHGSHSELAARAFAHDLVYISCTGFPEIFQAVEKGVMHFGIVPVESTIGGTFTEVNELLVETSLTAVAEIRLPIRHCLLTLPETDPEELRVVYSHRHALGQCQKFIEKHRLEARPYYDMAAAAKMLVQERPEASAAIASSFSAEYYHLKTVAEGIEDLPGHVTRFLVLSAQPASVEGNKCSIIFGTEHKAGSLFSTLKEFADASINLTRIESMPHRLDPGNYVIFLDFSGSPKDPAVARVLQTVESKSPMYKFLGCYPAAE